MIFISKLFTAFAFPPGLIIAALILVIVFIPRRYKLVLSIITAVFYLLSIQPVNDLLLRPLEDAYPPLLSSEGASNGYTIGYTAGYTGDEPDAIVVLGGGTVQGSPEAISGQDTLAPDAMKRAVFAFNLRDYFSAPYVFSGGKVFDYDQESEADTAGILFTALGLPPERIVLETNSRNTWENARETAKLGYKRVILVTSAYHIPRSVYCFERNGMTVIPAPTDYKCDRGRNYDFLSFLPSMGSLHKNYMALHEYIGLLSYRLIY